MSDFTPTPIPSFSGKYRNHMLLVPECINECSGIRIFGRTLKSFVFSTDVATIASCNADAVIAVYSFTPQPRIVRAVLSVADMPVLVGTGGGFTTGARAVAQAMEAEHCGAYGVVLNAPVSADILRDIKTHIDIPVVATIVSATQDTEARRGRRHSERFRRGGDAAARHRAPRPSSRDPHHRHRWPLGRHDPQDHRRGRERHYLHPARQRHAARRHHARTPRALPVNDIKNAGS